MATPGFTVQTNSQTLQQYAPNVLSWTIKDLAGVAVDISSGFVATLAQFFGSGIDAAGSFAPAGTFAYGADGVLTLTQTMAQSALVHAGNWPFILYLSNDANTTRSVAARGNMQVIGSAV